MASAEASEVFNCSVEQFYKIITDYENYPQFLKEVSNCKVVQEQGSKKLVEYSVSLPMKTFKYNLWMNESPMKGINWELASGDVFKTSMGSWKLQDEAGKCRATYSVDASFKIMVPNFIAQSLVSVNLPGMMSAYHKRVKSLYGK